MSVGSFGRFSNIPESEKLTPKETKHLFKLLKSTQDNMEKDYLIQKILTGNMGLVYNGMNKRKHMLKMMMDRTHITEEEVKGYGAEYLWEAISRYNVDLGYAFSTLACVVIDHGFIKLATRTKSKRFTDIGSLRLDQVIDNAAGVDEYDKELNNYIPDERVNTEREVTNKALINALMERIEHKFAHRPEWVQAFKLHLQGDMTQWEIAEVIGVSQVQVSRIVSKIQAYACELRDKKGSQYAWHM